MGAGKEWLALLQYAVVAVQGSTVAQANLAWLLQRSSAYDTQHKAKVCMRLLTQAGKGGLADAWVDAGNMEYRSHQLGMLLPFLFSACNLHHTTAAAVLGGLIQAAWLAASAIIHELTAASSADEVED